MCLGGQWVQKVENVYNPRISTLRNSFPGSTNCCKRATQNGQRPPLETEGDGMARPVSFAHRAKDSILNECEWQETNDIVTSKPEG